METSHWGSLPPVDDTAQVTKAMLEMKKARPFVIDPNEITIEIEAKSIISRTCPYAIANAKLAEYVNDGQAYVSKHSNNLALSSNENPPLFPSLNPLPESLSSDTRAKVSQKHLQLCPVQFKDVHSSLKSGVALTAASHGFTLSNASALEMLTDVTHKHIETLCQSLRSVLDVEAKTGRTAFYDAVDQVLHDMDIGNIIDLGNFYKENIIEYNKNLTNASEEIQDKIKTIQEKNSKALAKIKQEKHARSGWVPVTNLGSGDTPSVFNSQNSRWKPFVKTEQQPTSQQHSTLTSNSFGNILYQEPTNVESSDDYWPRQKRFCR